MNVALYKSLTESCGDLETVPNSGAVFAKVGASCFSERVKPHIQVHREVERIQNRKYVPSMRFALSCNTSERASRP
jgi:hypothetical protein